MKPDAETVQAAIGQTKPFRSVGQEAVIALFLAAEVVRRPFTRMLEEHGDITHQQYNVLRILRGAGENGLPTLEIGVRMIEQTPGITRLIDRLEAKGLVTRTRSDADRRQVVCRISARGTKLLKELDPDVNRLDDAVLDTLSRNELETLVRLLNRIRRHSAQ
jgi:DNA-binding MarR family transcriptional regulator